MQPKRKSDDAAPSARKEPRLMNEEPKTVRKIDPDGDLHLAVKETNSPDNELSLPFSPRILPY